MNCFLRSVIVGGLACALYAIPLLQSATIVSASVVADPDDESANAQSELIPSASTETWNRSAAATANQLAVLIEANQLDEALALTHQVLAFPRHPDRNDPYGWGHATQALPLAMNALIQSEQWDGLIELVTDPDAIEIGNEIVESQRLRSLAFARWASQNDFVASDFIAKLKRWERRRSNRLLDQESWNEICVPEDLIEIDHAFFAAAVEHIKSSEAFVAKLESTNFSSAALKKLKSELVADWVELPDAKNGESHDDSHNSPAKIDFSDLRLHQPAPDFRLPKAGGEEVSLSESNGHPRVVVFYLGQACFHCARQLSKFAPRIPEFEKEGIKVIGVSTDTLKDLEQAVAGYDQRIPLLLVSDGDQKVFKQFGLHPPTADAEPPHATFLIDAEGKILWRDKGDEPFMDIEFLLKESKRLFRKK